jgi:hypothetical protein
LNDKYNLLKDQLTTINNELQVLNAPSGLVSNNSVKELRILKGGLSVVGNKLGVNTTTTFLPAN